MKKFIMQKEDFVGNYVKKRCLDRKLKNGTLNLTVPTVTNM